MTQTKKRVLFVSSEMSPFLETSPLATVARMLPQALQEQENEIRILVPRFGVINERRNRLHEVVRLSGINISIDDNDNPLIIKVASIPQTKMQVYFLDNEDYFHRKYVFRDEAGKLFDDNDERTIFFCKGVMETVKKLGWAPDIIHCQGWMTSLIPMYLKTIYKDEPVFKNTKVVYSVYENCFTENLDKNLKTKALTPDMNATDAALLKDSSCSSLHISAINYSDAVIKADENIEASVLKFLNKQTDKLIIEKTDHETFDFDNFVQFYDEVSVDLVTT